jgi:hypothetical protein
MIDQFGGHVDRHPTVVTSIAEWVTSFNMAIAGIGHHDFPRRDS